MTESLCCWQLHLTVHAGRTTQTYNSIHKSCKTQIVGQCTNLEWETCSMVPDISNILLNIEYKLGKMSNIPDALSRRHDHADIPNPAQVMIAVEHFKGFRAEDGINIISTIHEAQEDNESLMMRIQSTKNKEDLPPSVKRQCMKYAWEEGLLLYEGKIAVPDNKDILLHLLEQHHNSPIGGHQGQVQTLKLLSRQYCWPNMKPQVHWFVGSCKIYQCSKGSKQAAPGRNMPLPEQPWEEIHYDFILLWNFLNHKDLIAYSS